MKDMNIAKLTTVDLPLFNGIVSDLFPGVDTPTIDYSKVSSCEPVVFSLGFMYTYNVYMCNHVEDKARVYMRSLLIDFTAEDGDCG